MARLVPAAGAGHDLDPTAAAAIPAYGQPLSPTVLHSLSRFGQGLALDTWSAFAGVGRWRLEQVGLGVQLADEAEAVAVAAYKAGDFVRAVGRVADEEEGSLGKLQQHQPQKPAHELGRSTVGTVSSVVVLLAVIEVHQDGQGPRARCEREGDQDSEYHPLVTVTPGSVSVGRANRVAVTALAVNLLARMAIDGVIADQSDDALGQQLLE